MKTEENTGTLPPNTIFLHTIKGKTTNVKEVINNLKGGENLKKMINYKDVRNKFIK